MAHSHDKSIENVQKEAQMFFLLYNELKLPLNIMFKGLKETRYEELNNSVANMCH